MATLNAALLIVTAMAMREGGRKAFGLCKAPAQALSLSLSLSLQQSLRSLSAAIVVGFNVLCSPCPCVDTLPGLRFLHVFVFCGCANRESSTPGEGREGGSAGFVWANDVRA